jgi:Carboxypeptidase regulatory-like domain/TonB dependent receptor
MSLRTSLTRLVLAASAALVTLPGTAVAQSTYGGVVGVLTDATKAVVPGVTVVLTEVQTKVARTTTTGGRGSYEFLNLVPGRYTVEAQIAGFQKATVAPFPVGARETVRIDVELAAAQASEEVTVKGGAPLINTENPTVAEGVDNRHLQELPFTFRTTNTSPVATIAVLPEVQKGTGYDFSLSGGQTYQNEVSVDGISSVNVRRNGIGSEDNGAVNIFPSVEGIEEIRVSSVNNNAELAQTGDITTITKSGTNDWHGSAFMNFNNEGLNANPNYFSKSLPDKSDNRDYGGSVSGPLVREKTFFFATYERLNIQRTGVGLATVPEADFRTGNFSRLATTLIDPQTGQPFPGNLIPANRINPVSAVILKNYISAPTDGGSIARYSIPASDGSHQFDARVDQNFSQSNRAFARFSWKQQEIVSPTTYAASGPRTKANPTRNLVLSDNWAASSSLLNELRFGFTTSDITSVTSLDGSDFVAATGLKLLSQNLPQGSGSTFIDIAGYTRFGEGREEPLTQKTIQFGDNVTWARERHTFKAGVDVRHFNWTSPAVFTGADDFGVFRFRASLTGGTGNALADFLLGVPASADQTQAGPNIDGSSNNYGFFVQDEWRASRSVTVNFGIRYDLNEPFTDAQLNITNFLRDTPNGDVVVPNEASRELAKPAFTSGLGSSRILTAAEAGLPESLRYTDTNNISPRIGVAWRPFDDNRTVLRFGYGLYTSRILGAVFNSLTAVHTSDNETFDNTFDPARRTFGFVFPNTFAGDANRGETAVGNQNFSTANDPHFKDPRTQQWSFSLDREIGRSNAVRFTYSGRQDTNLTLAPDLNEIHPNTVGFANLPASVRPFPNWRHINTRDNGGESSYHDLTFQMRGEAVPSLHYEATYKWAHSSTNIEGPRGAEIGGFTDEINGRTINRFDPEYTRGPMQSIPDHRAVATAIWNLPFLKQNAVLGGWAASAIMNWQSGTHLTAYYSSHCGSGTDCNRPEKADAVAGQDPNSGPRTTAQWFNTAAYSTAAFFDAQGRPIFAGRFGNAPNGAIEGPGYFELDFGLFKDFKIGTSAKLRVQAQASNVTNHPNYANPVTDLSSPNYGQVTSLAGGTLGSRVIVLGARVVF